MRSNNMDVDIFFSNTVCELTLQEVSVYDWLSKDPC